MHKAMRIAAIRMRKELLSARVLCTYVVIAIYFWCLMEPVNEFAKDYACRVGPYGAVFIFSSIGSQVVLAIGAVFLFCNAPYRDSNYPYLVLRSGMRSWTLGNAIYIFQMAGIYVLFMILASVLPTAGNIEFTGSWGKVWTTLARTYVDDKYVILFEVSNGIRSNLQPAEALVLSGILEWLCFSLMGLIVYFGNSIDGKATGTLMSAFFAFYDLIIYNMLGNRYYKISPVSLARLSLVYEGAGITLDYALLALMAAGVAAVGLCYLIERRMRSGGKL